LRAVAAAPSVQDNRRKHGDDEDNCFRPASSRLARSSGLRSQRRGLRGRSPPGGMRRSTRRSRRPSRLRLWLPWRSRRTACLWRTLLLARRRSCLPLTGHMERASAMRSKAHSPTSLAPVSARRRRPSLSAKVSPDECRTKRPFGPVVVDVNCSVALFRNYTKPRNPLRINGGPGRTRTCNQTVMSGRL
jgi:hypothetical protein